MKFYRFAHSFNPFKVILSVILTLLLNNFACAEPHPISSEKQFKIAIFKEEGFPALGTPHLLTPEWLYDVLSEYFYVDYLDISQLTDRIHFKLDSFDLLILPYGEAFPYEAFSAIKEYLFKGGGFLNIAGRPFWTALEKNDGIWQEVNINDPYKEFLSPLGIKYYELSDSDNIGLSVTTSLSGTPIAPTHGNIFPYRIPVRDFYSFKTIYSKEEAEATVFIKSWRNPYVKDSKEIPRKWCLIGARGERHPLNPMPQNAVAQQKLFWIIEYLTSPVVMYDLETNFAAYYQKEKVEVSVRAVNYGMDKEQCTLEIEFYNNLGEVVHRKTRPVRLRPGQRMTMYETWHPKEFGSDFYKITAMLKKGERVLDKEENGFVILNKSITKNGPSLEVEGNQFIINGNKSFIFGTNYYESKLGELMWIRPNILSVREDFKSMRTMGLNFVRIHYHHSKWFRDYFSRVLKENLEPYLQISDNTALPSERSLRILDAVIQLAQEQGLIFCMDIFSLVPEEMGNPIGWLGLKERIIDKDKVVLQKKFVEIISRRYRDVPGIIWDLWNEPRLEKKDLGLLRDWVEQIKEVFRDNGDNHLITIGDNLSLYLSDVLDYASIHTYNPGEFHFLKGLNKPFVFQEVWNDAGSGLSHEMRQAKKLRDDFEAFLKTEAAGFVPWQWTRQARLWNNASEAERWDDELGLCVRDDGTFRPAGRVYSLLIGLTK